MPDLESERYPIGRFPRLQEPLAPDARSALIDAIAAAPADLRSIVAGLADHALETRYRDGGWTIRQVVHHVPDSHMNAYVRMKLAATQEAPAVVTYDEVRWADLPDGRSAPVEWSLQLLEALHRRWVLFLRRLPGEAFRRIYVHPDWGSVPLDEALALYAWHGRHHAAHVRLALGRLHESGPLRTGEAVA